MNLKFARMSL